MANLNLSQFGENTSVSDADYTFVWDSAASISKKVSRNSWLNSGELTSSAPVTISQTWNAGSNVMTALKVVATDTVSGTTSNLLSLDLSTNNVLGEKWRFKFEKGGLLKTTGNIELGIGLAASSALLMGNGFYAVGGGNGLYMGGGVGGYIFNHGATQLWRGSADHILEQRNSSNPQTFNVYGTYSTSPSLAYSRLAISCDTSGNATLTTQSTGVAGTVSINGVPVGLGKGNVSSNLAIGTSALAANTTGTNNVALGPNVLLSNTTGTFNFGLAENALRENTTGSFNAALGASALQLNTTGSNNTALGVGAGAYAYNGGTLLNNTNSSSSIFIGRDTRPDNLAQNNQIVIGYQAIGIGSNSVVLGNDSITKTALKGNVGIGTTAPGAKLQVVGNAIFGENVASGSTTPLNVSFGGSYGTNAPGNKGNLKWDLYRDETGGRSGIGISGGLMEFQGGTGVAFGFYPNNGTTSALRISSDLNVGIGTTSPTSKLHVVGDARITTDVFASAVYGFAGANTTCGINGSDGVGPIIHANQNGKIGFFSGTSFSGVMDTVLVRDGAANTLALRNGTSAQRFNVYNSYLNAGVDYERMGIGDIPAIAGNVGLYYARAGSGAAKGIYIWNDSNSSIVLSTNATNRWQILNTGHLHAWTDNQFDIGASGANRPRNVYAGSSFQSGSGNAGGLYIGAFGGVTSFSNGVFTWWNNTVNNFDRFQLGGTTDVFPAIARDGAGIKFTGAAAGSTAWIKVPPVAVSALPLAATAGAGARAFVNDALAPTFGSAVTGGGSGLVPVYSDGSAWNVG